MLKKFLFAALLLTSFSTITPGQVVTFDNFNSGFIIDAASSDLSGTIGGELVDDVSFTATTQVTGINWSGAYFPSFLDGGDGVVPAFVDNFVINVYSDLGGAPNTLLQSFSVGNNVNRTTGAIENLGFVEGVSEGTPTQTFDYSAAIDFTFAAGVNHWISVLNNTIADGDNFNQLITSAPGNAFFDINGGDQEFISQGLTTVFQLTSPPAIPEPGSVGVLALGLIGLVTRRRRKR